MSGTSVPLCSTFGSSPLCTRLGRGDLSPWPLSDSAGSCWCVHVHVSTNTRAPTSLPHSFCPSARPPHKLSLSLRMRTRLPQPVTQEAWKAPVAVNVVIISSSSSSSLRRAASHCSDGAAAASPQLLHKLMKAVTVYRLQTTRKKHNPTYYFH